MRDWSNLDETLPLLLSGGYNLQREPTQADRVQARTVCGRYQLANVTVCESIVKNDFSCMSLCWASIAADTWNFSLVSWVYLSLIDMKAMDNDLARNACFQSSPGYVIHLTSMHNYFTSFHSFKTCTLTQCYRGHLASCVLMVFASMIFIQVDSKRSDDCTHSWTQRIH